MDSSQNPFEIGDGKEFQLSAVEFDDVTVDSVVLVIRPLNSGYSARLPVISADAAHYNDTISNLENGHCQPFLVGAGRPTSAFVRKPGGPAMFGHSQRELTASFRTNGSLRDRFVFHKGTAGRGTFAHDVETSKGNLEDLGPVVLFLLHEPNYKSGRLVPRCCRRFTSAL